jgi:PhzF family phenazine biosynthesis protein
MPSSSIPIFHLDVFAKEALKGNPLAVLLPPVALETAQMQAIANWLNLSETTFAEPFADGSGYRVRIFTPQRELPFAGHPTIGTATALYLAGLLDRERNDYIQSCAAGELPITRSGDLFSVRTPAVHIESYPATADAWLAGVMGRAAIAPAMQCDNGARWAVARYDSVDALLALTPSMHALAQWNLLHRNLGLAAFALSDDPNYHVEVRCFVPIDGIPEDPVTGSGNASVAAFMEHQQYFAKGLLPRAYVARQGRAMGRDGYLNLHVKAIDNIELAGVAVRIARGEFQI